MVGGTNETKIRFVREFLKGTTMQIGFYIKNSRNAATCKNIDAEIIQWNSFYYFVHFWAPLLSQRINLENRFTCNGQFPVSHQIFLMNFNPCLHKFHLGWRQAAAQNFSIINSY